MIEIIKSHDFYGGKCPKMNQKIIDFLIPIVEYQGCMNERQLALYIGFAREAYNRFSGSKEDLSEYDWSQDCYWGVHYKCKAGICGNCKCVLYMDMKNSEIIAKRVMEANPKMAKEFLEGKLDPTPFMWKDKGYYYE